MQIYVQVIFEILNVSSSLNEIVKILKIYLAVLNLQFLLLRILFLNLSEYFLLFSKLGTTKFINDWMITHRLHLYFLLHFHLHQAQLLSKIFKYFNHISFSIHLNFILY
jgi:hypothetical protein